MSISYCKYNGYKTVKILDNDALKTYNTCV
jgi:hypothetical protein